MFVDRPAAVAGRFYPDEPEALRAMLAEMTPAPVEMNVEVEPAPALALVAPHAGYVYSGRIAGAVYARAQIPETVFVLGPNHTGRGGASSILLEGRYRLPGAEAPVAADAASALAATGLVFEDPDAQAREHAIEVQLPFLLHRRPEVRIVPIVLAGLGFDDCAALGEALAQVAEAHDALVVASTDMNHFADAETTRRLDEMALERLLDLDPEGLYRTVREQGISMCGFIPTTVALIASLARGAREATLVAYGHSGEVSGDHDRVVGYAGVLVR